jgi:hypothetical protein
MHPRSVNQLYAAGDDLAVRLAAFQHQCIPWFIDLVLTT